MAKKTKFLSWLLEGKVTSQKPEHHHQDAWWRVLCLVGVDYFSSMGFQPSIAFLAAGLVAPLATLNLVIITLIGALPAYWLVAKESPHGQGSLYIFEKLIPGWKGKTLILIILGFAATDFIITITMCAADATAHIVENPMWVHFPYERIAVTVGLILLLGGLFLKGFGEAIIISLVLVLLYLAVNAVTLSACVTKLLNDPTLIQNWYQQLKTAYPSTQAMFTTSILVFPQLALGLSGFETGAAVMPLIKTTPPDNLAERIRKTRYLLLSVAVIMGFFLLIGTFSATVLIPAELFKEGGEANGRALAYLTHEYFGEGFGTIYDLSTVAILWFAGASGMAALLALVPQYLPRYGMAPDWAAARRPIVLVITLISVLITIIFKAEVDAQAGAWATGLLVLITSGTTAVLLSVWKKGWLLRIIFSLITAAFLYSSVAIILKRPDGLQISLFFIGAILSTSLLSRASRSTELRIDEVKLDGRAVKMINSAMRKHQGEIRLLAHKPDDLDYHEKEKRGRRDHSIQHKEGDFIFLEVTPQDVSDFIDTSLEVTGHSHDDNDVLRCSSPSVPNAIAALLLHIRDTTGKVPHVYFGWTEGHPLGYMAKYILFGEGETAPLTREILRKCEPDPDKRPRVHVG